MSLPSALALRPRVPLLVVLALSAVVAATATSASAQVGGFKIAVFDKQRVVDQSKLGVAAKARFERLQGEREAEVETKRKAYEALQKAYEQQAGVLSDEKKLERQRELARSRDELQSVASNADRDLQRAYQQALIDIVQKLDPVIADFAKAEGYDMLFDQTQYAFAKDSYDVTDRIIGKLDATHQQ